MTCLINFFSEPLVAISEIFRLPVTSKLLEKDGSKVEMGPSLAVRTGTSKACGRYSLSNWSLFILLVVKLLISSLKSSELISVKTTGLASEGEILTVCIWLKSVNPP